MRAVVHNEELAASQEINQADRPMFFGFFFFLNTWQIGVWLVSQKKKAILSEMHQHALWVGTEIPETPSGFTSAQYKEQALG